MNLRIPFLICLFSLCSTLSGQGSSDVYDIDPSRVINVGYSRSLFSNVNHEDITVTLNSFTIELLKSENSNFLSKTIIFEDVDSMIDSGSKNGFDLITITTQEYFAIRDKIHITPSIVSSTDSDPFRYYVLLTSRKDDVTELSQIQDKRIAVTANMNSQLATMWLDVSLAKSSLPLSSEFLNLVHSDKESSAILDLFFGKIDGCLVLKSSWETLVELNPQVGKQLQVLIESPGYLVSVMCLRGNLEEGRRQFILDAALNFGQYARSKQFLKLFQIQDIIQYDDSYLESIQKLTMEHEALLN